MQKIVPDVVANQTIIALAEHDTALRAGELMAQHDISAVLVNGADGLLLGIVTERDLSRRVVATNRSPSDTPVGEIMTGAPRTLSPDDSPYDAMQVMRHLKVRHLPIAVANKAVGMVSVRDLRHAIAHQLEPGHQRAGAAVHRLLRRIGL